MPTLGMPKAIRLFSTPGLRWFARLPMRSRAFFRFAYGIQVGRFFRDPEVREEFLPVIRERFMATPSSVPAFFALNEDLWPTVRSRTRKLPLLREFDRPVRIIFGDQDTQLNVGVARRFHELFPRSELFLIPGARHFVQMDEPERVAELIASMPLAD
jgi:haloalkane dehalogenase